VWSNIITGLFTAVFGVLGFTAGQILLKIFDPALRLRALFGEVARDLWFFFDKTPLFSDAETRAKTYRKHAAAIHESLHQVIYYPVLRWVFGLPEKESVIKASRELFALSLNELEEYSPERHRQRLESAYRITGFLRLPPLSGGLRQDGADIPAS
jgi:hypothetical protein